MPEYLSGQISFGGLTENTDFATLREQLKTIEMRKANQLARWKADWQARIDAFQQVRTSLVTLQSKLNSMNSVEKFLVKGAESSQPSVAKATAGPASSPGVYTLEVEQLATTSSQTVEISSADKNTSVNTGSAPLPFAYTYKGKYRELSIPPNTTLEGLKNIINNDAQNPGVVAQLISTPGGMIFQLRGKETGTAASLLIEPTKDLGLGTWSLQPGQDAQIRFNGWPASGNPPLTLSGNTLTDILDTGLTVNLYSTGTTTITVAIDSSAVRKNVEEFVDAVNAFRATIQELTKFDENKTVYEPEYAQSQSEMQKGSVLTGNYGVQMISSRLKSILSSQGLGFAYRQTEGGVTNGDLFSSLSQIGIMTNAEQGSALYGLLEINLISGNEAMPGALSFEDALNRDPVGVAMLFAANNEGYTTSGEFGYVSSIAGITKPGLYEVSYTVSSGNVSGTINGKPFKWSPADGNQAGIYSNDPPPNEADGLVIELYDLAEGIHEGEKVGVRQGKVNELLSVMDGAQGFLGAEGTLAVLENNYKGIIANIDKKLVKEDERLIKWERTIKARFARLETQIANYQQLQSNLESQIAQLGQKNS